MSQHDELERGQLAADILGNRVFTEAMQAISDEITARWKIEPDEAKREHLWRMSQCQKRFESLIIDAMTTGKIRQKQIEAEQSRLQRAKIMFTRAA